MSGQTSAMIPKPWQRAVLAVSVVLCLASAAAVVWLWQGLSDIEQRRLHAAKARAAAQADEISAGISARLGRIVPLVDGLAADLSSGALGRADVPARLESDFKLSARDDILEIGVAYAAPTAADPDAPHYGIKDGAEGHFQIEDSYDYLVEPWYRDTLAAGTHWSEPYFGGATHRWVAGYASAFEGPDGQPGGVVRVNFKLTKIRDEVAIAQVGGQKPVGNTAYAVLLSANNRIIAHPIGELLGSEAADGGPILDHLLTLTDPAAETFNDPKTGESYSVFVRELDASGWRAAVVFNQREIAKEASAHHYHEGLTIAAVIFLLFGSVIVLRSYRATEAAIWRLSLASSLIFSGGIVVIWALTLAGAGRPSHPGEIEVTDRTAVEALLHGRDSSGDERPRIATGVYVQSLRFTGANDVVLTGYLWQRPPPDFEGDLPGVVLPEAEEVSMTPVRDGLWYFETTLRQQFDYSHYPFDREDVWIRMWAGDLKNLTREVVLVPDFEGYASHRPADLPGLEADVVLAGWQATETHFSYRANRYNAGFGLEPEFDGGESLELYFNVGLKREFLSPFIADFIPIIVVAFLVFAVLMSSTRRDAQLGLFGFSASAVLGYCAALFFVLIVSHIHLRETLASSGIIYIEWFYFTMYFAILAVSTNALVFASETPAPLIHFRDNLVAKQSFWPLVTALLFVVTVVVFH